MIKFYLEQPESKSFIIKFEPTRENAGVDLYATNGVERELAAGWEDGKLVMPPGSRFTFHTGVYLAMPAGVEAQVRGRSGLTRDHGITPMIGTVDPSYRGEVKITLFNLGGKDYTVLPGDRVAQLVFAPTVPFCFGTIGDNRYPARQALTAYDVEFRQVFSRADLGMTTRGESGHGSSGR